MAERIDPEAWSAAAKRIKVPRPFYNLVMRELAGARQRALTIMPLPVKTHQRAGTRWNREASVTVRTKGKGKCVGCGCPYDDKTPGCSNCDARHSMRRTHAHVN